VPTVKPKTNKQTEARLIMVINLVRSVALAQLWALTETRPTRTSTRRPSKDSPDPGSLLANVTTSPGSPWADEKTGQARLEFSRNREYFCCAIGDAEAL
jgi:hypothetical protein